MDDPAGADPAFVAPAPADGLQPGPRPTFSVIVAVYQGADVVADAVASALAQTRPPLEILVADDGSTDDVAGALAAYGDRVRLRRLPHQGAAAVSNVIAAEAVGDFLVVLDADDTWHPRRLERLGDLAVARPDLDLMTTDAWFVTEAGRHGRFYDANAFAVTDQTTEILRRTFFFAHVAVRRSAWRRVGGFSPDLSRGYDWDLQLRLLLTGTVAGCVREPLVDYAVHSDSLSANRYESLLARVTLLDRAEARFDLTQSQRTALAEAREGYRQRALVTRAERTLLDGAPGRRSAALALAVARGTRPRRRLRAATAAVAPGWAGRRLRSRVAQRGRAQGDRRVD